MATVNIDGQNYDTDQLPESGKKQLTMIQFVDRKIIELQGDIAVYQTARSAYSKALTELLLEGKADVKVVGKPKKKVAKKVTTKKKAVKKTTTKQSES